VVVRSIEPAPALNADITNNSQCDRGTERCRGQNLSELQKQRQSSKLDLKD